MTTCNHDHSQWISRWGKEDQIGSGHYMTAEKRLAALASVKLGKMFDVSHVIGQDAPYMAPNQTPFLLSMWASWKDSIKRRRKMGFRNDAGSNVDRLEMTTHVGTHIDALGHFSSGGRLYNANCAEEVVSSWGLDKLGIEHAPPMITRGIMLDVAGFDGGDFLEPGRVVTPEDLQRASDNAGVVIESGDIVMIRTGWGRFFGVDNARYLKGEPGIDLPAARWLVEREVGAIGVDNMAVEVLPNPDHGLSLPVHQYTLADTGTYLIENLALEELAAEKLYSFCFILLATKYRGATGCPVRPVAVI